MVALPDLMRNWRNPVDAAAGIVKVPVAELSIVFGFTENIASPASSKLPLLLKSIHPLKNCRKLVVVNGGVDIDHVNEIPGLNVPVAFGK